MRMQENVEISNPMYQSQDLEEESDTITREFPIDTEQVCVWESAILIFI